MSNDTTTLNGALSQLGETMATNITAKGVSASASDGLTTLAGKILQISGDTPTPTPTILFEDGGVTGDVNTDYFNLGGTINANVSSDGTNISCSSYQDSARCPNVVLSGDFEINYTLVSRSGDGGGCFIILPSDISGSSFTYTGYIDSNTSDGWIISYNGEVKSHSGTQTPCSVKITREDTTFTVYVDDVQQVSKSITSADIYMGWKTHSAGGRNYTFKDLTITSGSTPTNPCEQYQTEIANAITYINGDGT